MVSCLLRLSTIGLLLLGRLFADSDICQTLSRQVKSNYDVIIIGAGTAGLLAAERLHKANITNFLIIEARNRTGGRIHTTAEGDHVIDLGAQFLRGTINNPVYDFALEQGLAVTDAENPFIREDYYTSEGVSVPQSVADDVYVLLLSAAQDVYRVGNYSESFGSQLRFRFRQRLSSEDDYVAEKEAVFKHRYNIMSATIGADIANENLASELDYSIDLGNLYAMLRRGYSSVLDKIQAKIKLSRIRTSSVVSHVYWNLTCRHNSMAKGAVQLTDKRFFSARTILVTLPLGVLKSGTVRFQPDLPPVKANAIANLGYGCLNKVFFRWKQPWWHVSYGTVTVLWLNKTGTIVDPIKVNLSLYANETMRYWYRTSTGFNAVWGQTDILQTWFYGKWAKIVESLPDDEVQSVLLQVLRLRFDTDVFKVPVPLKIIRTSWCSDPFSRGGFTYLNMQSRSSYVHDLATPLPNSLNPSLFFAGEATGGSNPRWATVRAAWESGIREATRIMQTLRQNDGS